MQNFNVFFLTLNENGLVTCNIKETKKNKYVELCCMLCTVVLLYHSFCFLKVFCFPLELNKVETIKELYSIHKFKLYLHYTDNSVIIIM